MTKEQAQEIITYLKDKLAFEQKFPGKKILVVPVGDVYAIWKVAYYANGSNEIDLHYTDNENKLDFNVAIDYADAIEPAIVDMKSFIGKEKIILPQEYIDLINAAKHYTL